MRAKTQPRAHAKNKAKKRFEGERGRILVTGGVSGDRSRREPESWGSLFFARARALTCARRLKPARARQEQSRKRFEGERADPCHRGSRVWNQG